MRYGNKNQGLRNETIVGNGDVGSNANLEVSRKLHVKSCRLSLPEESAIKGWIYLSFQNFCRNVEVGTVSKYSSSIQMGDILKEFSKGFCAKALKRLIVFIEKNICTVSLF